MARYIDKDHWEEEIVIPNTNTPILGGQPVWEGDRLVDGFANIPPAILADRTRHLKNKVESIEYAIGEDFQNALRKEENLADLEDIQQAKYNLELNLVDNTRDMDKPVSVPQQEALDTKVDKIPGKGLSTEDYTTAEKNKLAGVQAGAQVNSVTSVAGRVGAVVLSKNDVGLNNVDNTSDVDKPISNATTTALNTKADNSVTISAGNGLTGGGNLTTSRSLALGTPSTITGSTTNSVTSTSHTHAIQISTDDVGGLQSALDGKVDKVAGMGLSQENFTTAEKVKLSLLEEPHFKGLFPSLAALEAAVPSPVPGDYAQVAGANPGDPSVTYVWDDPLNQWVEQVPEISAEQVKILYESNPDTNAFTDVEKSKLTGIANGATANATNAQLRDRATHTGVQPISSVSGLQGELDSKADKTISVVAGTGLSGGGDLSANRTLNVQYGTTAGTAAQGNDSRITGAAQKASNLSDLASASAARNNLGLGNAATKDVTDNFKDSTEGRLLQVGDGGILKASVQEGINLNDPDVYPIGFSYIYTTGHTNGPTTYALHVKTTKYANGALTQSVSDHPGTTWTRARLGENWTDWKQVLKSGDFGLGGLATNISGHNWTSGPNTLVTGFYHTGNGTPITVNGGTIPGWSSVLNITRGSSGHGFQVFFGNDGSLSWRSIPTENQNGSPLRTAFHTGNLPSWSQVSDKPGTATRWPSWSEVTGKPGTMPPGPASYGAVGQYIFAVQVSGTNNNALPGETRPGSSLRAASSGASTYGDGLSGTWRVLGHSIYNTNASLWQRIS